MKLDPLEKLLAEIRAALMDRADHPEAALDCIDDALEAYDQASTEATDDLPEWPQE